MIEEENSINTRTERSDAAKNRQRILNTAQKLFEQHGVEKVSMNQIAIEAKVGSGTLYRRYRNKGELCLDLIKDSLDLFFDDIESYLLKNKADPPQQKLKNILSLFIRFREKKAQLLTGVEDSQSTNPLKSWTRSPIYDELHQLLVGLFDEMTKSEMNHPHNVFKADLVLMALSRNSYSFQKHIRGYSPEEILEMVCSTFISLK